MYMNVKKGQLKEHKDIDNCMIEAERLANYIGTKIYIVKVVGSAIQTPTPENHGMRWLRGDDITLLIKYMNGTATPRELAPYYKRTCWAIQCRLHDLGLGKVHADRNYRGW